MPITRRQFELETAPKIEEWMKRIHAFLAAHKEQAFTANELKEQWRAEYAPSIWVRVHSDIDEALLRLIEEGAVAQRKVRGEYYYSVGHEPLEI